MVPPPVVDYRGSRSGTIGRATGRATCRLVVRLLVTCPDLSHDVVTGGTTNRTIGRGCHDGRAIRRRTERLIVGEAGASCNKCNM